MWQDMNRGPKLVIAALGAAAVIGMLYFGIGTLDKRGYLSDKQVIGSVVPPDIDLPTGKGQPSNPVAPIHQQSSNIPVTAAPSVGQIRYKTIPWNATAALHLANGDQETASGSLMAKRGINMRIDREDDSSKMTADLAAFAKDNSQGVHFVTMMGDGAAAYIRGVNEALKPFNQTVEIVGMLGYSRGEDKCIIDANTPVKGSLIAAVLRDGDWNSCVKYGRDNKIAINSNEKTWDPNAINFVGVSSFDEGDIKFISGACETRPVVDGKRLTGETKKVCVNGTATWTPGDVKVAHERGNLRVLASTADYIYQMPAVIIGNTKWMSENPKVVRNILAAALEAGEILKTDKSALLRAGAIQAKVYREQNAAYWAKYFTGVTEIDKGGKSIKLGGSVSAGLGDNAYLFGLAGNDNIYKAVYYGFGKFVQTYYPEELPQIIPYEKVVNTQYLEAILSDAKSVAPATVPVFEASTKTSGTVVAEAPRTILFKTGSSELADDRATVQVLNDIVDSITVTGLSVVIEGHTDSAGDKTRNLALSRARAQSVVNYIRAAAPKNFPVERISAQGFGQSVPIADNNTDAGRAQNRRVVVKMLTAR